MLFACSNNSEGWLQFKKGDVVNVLDTTEELYWVAELNGKIGEVPLARFERLPPQPVAVATSAAAHSAFVSASAADTKSFSRDALQTVVSSAHAGISTAAFSAPVAAELKSVVASRAMKESAVWMRAIEEWR